MRNKEWLSILGFILLMLCTLVGGPFITKKVNENKQNNINKNGLTAKAVVFEKDDSHKGNILVYKYSYLNNNYSGREVCKRSFFEKFETGDSIYILLDTINPSDSYIIKD